MKSNVYDTITARVTTALEAGTAPWKRPWTRMQGGPARSMATGKDYRGVNNLLLGMTAMAEGYASPWWGTYGKIAELSGMTYDGKRKRWVSPDGTERGVRKDEHSTVTYWWKKVTKPDPDDPDKPREFMTVGTWRVFNAMQATGLPEKYYPHALGPAPELPQDAETAFREYIARGPGLREMASNQAYYERDTDRITLPLREQFETAAGYLDTAFHEAGHSTGHSSRLDRPGIRQFGHFGDDLYSREELVAEMTGALILATFGIESELDNNASYLAGWLKQLNDDKHLIVEASTQAYKAADLILGRDRDAEESEEHE